MTDYIRQLFAAPEGAILTTDLEPAVSIDHNNRLVEGIRSLTKVLGITEMTPMGVGTTVKTWKYKKLTTPEQVGEGEEIGLTKYERKPGPVYTLTLEKFRKLTTAEAIQKVGRGKAVNDTDELLIKDIQKGIKGKFFTNIKAGEGTATPEGTGLQAALAAAWGQMATEFTDYDVEPVYFVHPLDISKYLETANVTLQTAFGFKYIEDFLGLGTVIIDPSIDQGSVGATAKENLNGVYVPMSGEVGTTFSLTADQTGLVGMTHYLSGSNASVETLIMSSVLFYAEDLSRVFKADIKHE